MTMTMSIWSTHCERKSLQAMTFAPVFHDTADGRKEAFAELERQANSEAPDTQNLGVLREGGRFDELREFTEFLLKKDGCAASCVRHGGRCSC